MLEHYFDYLLIGALHALASESADVAALGGDEAGNGYNMYKAYQWLKSVEKERAVICTSADGEWNSDL